MLRKLQYLPCIPTRGAEVPAGPDWFHEIKHNGYRLIVQREGKRVRLFTRRGYDWSDRCPLITQAALPVPRSFLQRIVALFFSMRWRNTAMCLDKISSMKRVVHQARLIWCR